MNRERPKFPTRERPKFPTRERPKFPIRKHRFSKSNMLFSKKYTYNDLKKQGLLKRLYFGKKKDITSYTKKMDDILFHWLGNVLNKKLKYNINRDIFLNKQEYKDALPLLIKSIMRCTKEVLYKKIESNLNLIDKTKLQCMGTASLGLAAKTVLEYDWYIEFEDGLYKHLTRWTDKTCSIKQLKKMEIDLFKTTDWFSCKKVLQRIYDRQGLLKKKYVEPIRPRKTRRSIKKKPKRVKKFKKFRSRKSKISRSKCNPKNKKSLNPKYICNSETHRWVLRDGKVGRLLD